MRNKYSLYPKAVEDLENIYTYSVTEFGFAKADSYIYQLENCFENLALSPEIAKKYDDVRLNLRAYNIGSHVIFFKKVKTGIVIIRILHQSMDYQCHL